LERDKTPREEETMPASLNPDLIVSDLDRSVRFYTEALGLKEADRVSGPEGPFFALLERDGLRLMMETPASPDPTTKSLLERQGRTPKATVNFWTIVSNVAAETKRLDTAGIRYHGPVAKPYGYTEVSFQDPDGYTWTLAEPVEKKA
jgi:catechol 2,3-dioxygenase-like lactoylglutathione lyase family enzyme